MISKHVAFIFVALISGCTTAPRRNFTNQSNPSSVATLHTASSQYSSDISFTVVDGQYASVWWRKNSTVVDILPGYRVVEVLAHDIVNKGTYRGVFGLDYKAGTVYRITLDHINPSNAQNRMSAVSGGSLAQILHDQGNLPAPVSASGPQTTSIQPTFDSALSQDIVIDGLTFSDLGSLLSHWRIISFPNDVQTLTNESHKAQFMRDLEWHLESIPYATAKVILDANSRFLSSIKYYSNSSMSSNSKTLGFVLSDRSSGDIIAHASADFKPAYVMPTNALSSYPHTTRYYPPAIKAPTFNK